MKSKVITSFATFLISLFITLTVFALFIFFRVDKKYLIYTGFIQSLVLIISPVGIYAGIKSKYESLSKRRYNRIGLWGNIILFGYMLIMAIYAIATPHRV